MASSFHCFPIFFPFLFQFLVQRTFSQFLPRLGNLPNRGGILISRHQYHVHKTTKNLVTGIAVLWIHLHHPHYSWEWQALGDTFWWWIQSQYIHLLAMKSSLNKSLGHTWESGSSIPLISLILKRKKKERKEWHAQSVQMKNNQEASEAENIKITSRKCPRSNVQRESTFDGSKCPLSYTHIE